MAELVIVTDSTADIPPAVREKYGIEVVPLEVIFGDEVYKDGVDITSAEFFDRLESSSVMPRTSQPSPGDFARIYKKLLDQQKEIISIHISAELSGTVHSAYMGRKLVGGGSKIDIVDSRLVSLALGLIVVEAAKAVSAGKQKDYVLELINKMIQKTRVYFLVDTLEYLARGGRIGKAQSLMGTLLNIKPILTFRDGIIYPYDKIRGFNKAVQRIVDGINEEFKGKRVLTAFVYGTEGELFHNFHQKITAQIDYVESVRGQLGPVVGTHGGPGIVGVVCYAD